MRIILTGIAELLFVAVFAGIWAAVAWSLVVAPGILAIAGVVYAMLAIWTMVDSTSNYATVRDQVRRELADFDSEIAKGGARALAFTLAKPFFRFAVLPYRSVPSAIAVACLLAAPWLLT